MTVSKIKRWVGYATIVLIVCGVLAASILIGTGWTAFGSKPGETTMQRIEASEQFKGSSFENELPEQMGPYGLMIERSMNAQNTSPTEPIPITQLTKRDFETKSQTGLRFVWLGHSSVLLQMNGRNVLIDPVFSKRSSPWQYMGPARFHDVPVVVDALPKLDAVLISHDHYDHLDHHTIRALIGKTNKFFVPLGIGSHLTYWGVPRDQIVELDWWESERVGELEFVAVPARHFSGRSGWDRNRTLWSGWVMVNSKNRVFYSGDTAMFPGFKEIGNKFGPFDLTIMEVGAYDPTWADVHLGPEQAIQAHIDAGGKRLFGVHWGTFNLASHGWTEPMERLKIAADEQGVELLAPQVGQFVEPANGLEWTRWWPELPFETAQDAPVVSSGL